MFDDLFSGGHFDRRLVVAAVDDGVRASEDRFVREE